LGQRVLRHVGEVHEVIAMLGGRFVHPVMALPGGVAKGVTPEMQQRLIEIGEGLVEFGQFSLGIWREMILGNQEYHDMLMGDTYLHRTHSIALVDANKQLNFYDGYVRAVDVEGHEVAYYPPAEYAEHIGEHVEPWTYVKFPYLKHFGWHGMVDGMQSGVYRSTPLARLNASEGLSTPLAQEAYEEFYDYMGGKPVHATLATHWARLIELLHVSERALALARHEELTDPDIRSIPTNTPNEGVGIVEAPRGLLTHHYVTDEQGLVKKVNMIVGTTNNSAAICMSVKKAAQALIGGGREITQGLLDRVEMAFRAYDPCNACATHAAPGEMALTVQVYDHRQQLVADLRRGPAEERE
ncbi:MAG: Ni/Fe hydrogenase subunit alpha, partial [Chloroflexi bacterium]|nr:Ni/Fe hydrogenase subunit alpha [Chloroflexota bacterium]